MLLILVFIIIVKEEELTCRNQNNKNVPQNKNKSICYFLEVVEINYVLPGLINKQVSLQASVVGGLTK